jgi:hypothetical protein
MGQQLKGLVSFVYGGIAIKGLAETSITYDLGEYGDTLPSTDAVVHISLSGASIVTSLTINVVKGTEGLNDLLSLIQAKTNPPLVVNDTGIGLKGTMPSANMTTIAISDSTNTNDVESYSFTFKGNLQIISMEG